VQICIDSGEKHEDHCSASISSALVFTRVHANTHVNIIDDYEGSQWAIFVRSDE